MIEPHLRGPLAASVLIGLSWLALVLIDPDGKTKGSEYVGIGYLLGTLFGQTTLAAAWSAFGPGALALRVPLALGWVFALWIGLVVNIGLHGGPGEVPFVLAVCLVGQWVLVLIPLGCLAWTYGLAFAYRPPDSDSAPRQLQFGIRQLMVLTAVVAVVLGTSRAALLLAAQYGSGRGESAIFIFLAVAAIVMNLPLVLAALLPRLAVVATVIVLALIALATAAELPLMNLLPSTGGPDIWHFVAINAVTAAWVLALIATLRWTGYGLAAR